MREIQISGCTEGKGSISKPLQIPPGSLKESVRASGFPSSPGIREMLGGTQGFEFGVSVSVLGGLG